MENIKTSMTSDFKISIIPTKSISDFERVTCPICKIKFHIDNYPGHQLYEIEIEKKKKENKINQNLNLNRTTIESKN